MADAKTTQDHRKIQTWAESRDGVPAKVEKTGGKDDVGLLRIHFPKASDDQQLQEIEWDDFFNEFDNKNLNFLYQDEKENGELSTFHKFVKE